MEDYNSFNDRVFKNFLYFFLLASSFAITSVFASNFRNERGTVFGHNYNFVYYFCLCLFVVGTLFLVVILRFFLVKNKTGQVHSGFVLKVEKILISSISIVVLVFAVLFFYVFYKNENTIPFTHGPAFLRQKVPHFLYFVFLLIMSMSFFYVAIQSENSNVVVRKLCVVFFTTVNTALLWAPCFYSDANAYLFHAHAYINSIVNLTYSLPFDDYNLSVYGHYALFYLPLLRLLGHNIYAIPVAICFFGVITYFCIFFVAYKNIQNMFVFLLTCIAISGCQTILQPGGQFLQGNPHRFLFPCIALAFVSFRMHSKSKNFWCNFIIEIIIGMCSFVWNSEMGVVSIGILCAYHIFTSWKNRDALNKLRTFIDYSFILLLLSLVSAYAILALWNITHNGDLESLRRFFYPNLNGFASGLRLKLPNAFGLHFLAIVFSFAAFADLFLSRLFNDNDSGEDDRTVIKAVVAFSCLATMPYFINRPSYSNIYPCWMQFVLLIALYSEYGICKFQSYSQKADSYDMKNLFAMFYELKTVFAVIAFVIISALAIESSCFESALQRRADTEWKTDKLKEAVAWIKKNVPKDSIGMGPGVPELFYTCNMDPKVHILDWSDFWDRRIEFSKSEILKYETAFVNKTLIDYVGIKIDNDSIPEDDEYHIVGEIQLGSDSYCLLRKMH